VMSGSTTGAIQLRLETARRLGAAIDGTVDELVLAVMPLSNNADIEACLSWREPG
jgi:hypothetical protein